MKQRQNDQLHVRCVREQRGPNVASATLSTTVFKREKDGHIEPSTPPQGS